MNLRSQHAYDPSSSSQVAPLTVKATLFFLAVLFSLISISLRVFHAFRERKAPGVSWLSELWLVRKLKKAQGTYYVTNGMLLWHLGTVSPESETNFTNFNADQLSPQVCGALLFGVYCALAAAGAAGNPVKGDAVLWALVGSPSEHIDLGCLWQCLIRSPSALQSLAQLAGRLCWRLYSAGQALPSDFLLLTLPSSTLDSLCSLYASQLSP